MLAKCGLSLKCMFTEAIRTNRHLTLRHAFTKQLMLTACGSHWQFMFMKTMMTKYGFNLNFISMKSFIIYKIFNFLTITVNVDENTKETTMTGPAGASKTTEIKIP